MIVAESESILDEPVSILKGIGKDTQDELNNMDIYTVEDLINYYPFRYEDCRVKEIVSANHDERVTITGIVQTMPVVSYYGRKKSRLAFKMLTGQHLVSVHLFNQHYLKSKIELNQDLTVTGKWDKNRLSITASSLKLNATSNEKQFEPVYHVKGDISVKNLRRWIQLALEAAKDSINETMPESLLKKYRLADRKTALQQLHFPLSEEDVKQARRRFVYEEFLLFQLKMQALRKTIRENSGGIQQKYDEEILKKFVDGLPFKLTNAQRNVLKDILIDLKSPNRMNRLLQGDVGSGKTVVAAISILASISAGYQTALMAPTEILAEQHVQSLLQFFGEMDIKLELLTSSVKTKARRDILERLASGEIDLIIGTHALIQNDVVFRNLGLVITDEQHRFGVEQRKTLREKGENPDVLFMTATPIPRTLAITAFGEMDVSVMNEMPAGRKEIITKWVKQDQLDEVLKFTQKQIESGRQAYVICPLIEESEKMDYQNAVDVHAQLVHFFQSKIRVGLMHGRLSANEKDEIMRDFAANKIQILVSTTVVEVGVNVPNATCMLVYDAERFGLSQLHQLRGRVGRGEHQSYCILIADPKNEIGVERLTIMTETNDGFVLSERDLQLRGPGDFFGKKQSGIPEFKLGDMVHDFTILEVARQDAAELVNSSEFWSASEYQALRNLLTRSGILEGDKLD
ncbi:MAG: recG [Bacillales bacterium]|jgi:ATP-dependent DNA helicase RecG|nr:recG [Bacillales bacterium]